MTRICRAPLRRWRQWFCAQGSSSTSLRSTGGSGGSQMLPLLRIEQLYPLHAEKLEQLLRKYQRAERYVWAQEEPQNMGAWSFLAPQLQALLPTGKPLLYVGRPPAASPATGSSLRHEQEQRQLIEQAFHRAVAETRVSIS
jgi:2-oxoglutarate dehydrogenase E1 component